MEDKGVGTATTVQDGVRITDYEMIIALPAKHLLEIADGVGADLIAAGFARLEIHFDSHGCQREIQGVVVRATVVNVVGRIERHHKTVTALTTFEHVCPGFAAEGIVAGAAGKRLIAFAAFDLIVAGAADDAFDARNTIAADFGALCEAPRQINGDTLRSLGDVERVIALAALECVI